MGVKGLWSLLNPVARPVQIESLEGKRLAIDSSIWLYQFQATMRDKDGRVLVNAHVLGFLRRINKLLFHGIKPVFVFDGGAPALKRATIGERKRRKAGAALNHARTAERLFAAQMRREAVKVAQSSRDRQAARNASAASAAAASQYAEEEGDIIPEDAVYLEDLEGRPGPSVPRAQAEPGPGSSRRVAPPVPVDEPPDPMEERRKRFRKHDPYRLPEASMPTVSTEEKPDARLATEEELKQFIDEMKPSDIDIESAEFRALPTEVQYEIIGDLRIRSRQQSHKRLTEMLRKAPTALDFSQAQIKNLAQRNALTQQLLTVTDMVGSAHLTIPVRIAAERNREYVLVKRGEEAGGGWALGIREGTKANPILVEPDKKAPLSGDSEDEDESGSGSETETDESEIQEISPPASSRRLSNVDSQADPTAEPTLREKRRKEVLDAVTARYAPPTRRRSSLDIPVKSFGPTHEPGSPALFAPDVEEVKTTANDEALALALQQEELGSDEEEADPVLVRALALSRQRAANAADEEDDDIQLLEERSSVKSEEFQRERGEESDESMEEVSLVPSERSTPIPFAEGEDEDEEEMEEVESIPLPANPPPTAVSSWIGPDTRKEKEGEGFKPVTSGTTVAVHRPRSDAPATNDALPIAPAPPAPTAAVIPPSKSTRVANGQTKIDSNVSLEPTKPAMVEQRKATVANPTPTPPKPTVTPTPILAPSPAPPPLPARTPSLNRPAIPSPLSRPPSPPADAFEAPAKSPVPSPSPPPPPFTLVEPEPERMVDPALVARPPFQPFPSTDTERSEAGDEDWQPEERDHSDGDDDDDDYDDGALRWSPSPPRTRPPLQPDISTDSIISEPDVEEDEGELAAEDVIAEKDDYARFMAQIKNRDLNEVRTEIDDEIRVLHNQAKVALRDSDEITQAMISQIQTLLRHFGIPYITAPMEAEAQCAKLAQLGLVDGIITDDSDVFLFGGVQCFKNIFNDAKYAECFLLADIDRELSLSRDRLISLAYLLGSDYTIGLPGVGPVVALELLSNFPGPKGVDKFKEWWVRVQRGQDDPKESNTKWKVQFKKRYAANIFLTSDWPNPLVREAYNYPTVDESDEPFHWGFPKLSALRAFLHEELSWSISKVDDELTPIVQRIARRGKGGALNVQGTLDPFFDTGAGSGNYAPRRRTTANVSKRLLAVIKSFREAEARVAGKEEEVEWGTMMQDLDPEDPKGRGTGKRRRTPSSASVGEGLEDLKEDEDEGWERKAAEVAAKEESSSQSQGASIPAPMKRKRAAPKKKKSEDGSVVASEDTNGDGGKPKRAPPKRKRTASRGEATKDPAETEGLEAIPPKDKKEHREQKKKWRRTVVAGSLNR